MCINLMKQQGIRKVFYSTSGGDMCALKINQETPDEHHIYASHGLKLMLLHQQLTGSVNVRNLPLTRGQKDWLLHQNGS